MNKADKDRVNSARLFATAAHAAVGQKRRYTFEPYIVHPAEVVSIVKTVPHTPEMLMCAWLHDVVEDTGVTIEDIRHEFGDVVADLVSWVTDVSKPEDGNRKVRKTLDRDHLARAPAAALTVKLADLISNTKSIAEHDPSFAVKYFKEKDALLKVMGRGDKDLMKRALAQVEVSQALMDQARLNKALEEMGK